MFLLTTNKPGHRVLPVKSSDGRERSRFVNIVVVHVLPIQMNFKLPITPDQSRRLGQFSPGHPCPSTPTLTPTPTPPQNTWLPW